MIVRRDSPKGYAIELQVGLASAQYAGRPVRAMIDLPATSSRQD